MEQVKGSTRFCGQDVSEAELALVRQVVAGFSCLSRMELAATVCETLGWLRPTGKAKARECREWLEDLEALGVLVLPPKQHGRAAGTRTRVPVTGSGEPGAPLAGSAGDLAPILVEQVAGKAERLLWRELVGRYHYLGHAVPFGAHLRYLVWASKPERAVVGCVQVSSPAWRMAARDRWIGWDDATRARNLQRIVCNSRFLILPWVQVRNLASTVLSRVSRQVGADWAARYGVEPYLLETLVGGSISVSASEQEHAPRAIDGGERFEGTCYRAAGWTALGSTTGRGRMDREHRREGLSPKRVFVMPLVKQARERLRKAAPGAGCAWTPTGPDTGTEGGQSRAGR